MSEQLDYDALWRIAVKEARQQVELMYPPEAVKERALKEIEIAQRLYRQMAYPHGRR